MRHVLTLCAVFLTLPAAVPATAQEAPPAEDEAIEEGLDLLGRGTRLLLEEFMQRMDPALENLRDELGPALEALREQVGRLDAYHPPEVLPNGDIIIRRKTPLERAPDPAPMPDGEAIEL